MFQEDPRQARKSLAIKSLATKSIAKKPLARTSLAIAPCDTSGGERHVMNDECPKPEVAANDNAKDNARSGTRAESDPGVSMMITRRQRAALRALGFSGAAIFEMTPKQAHAHLGLTT